MQSVPHKRPSTKTTRSKGQTMGPMTRDEIKSLREWLATWNGEAPNWADTTGRCVPIAKTTLARLRDVAERGVIGFEMDRISASSMHGNDGG
jgi:hypothetical protein